MLHRESIKASGDELANWAALTDELLLLLLGHRWRTPLSFQRMAKAGAGRRQVSAMGGMRACLSLLGAGLPLTRATSSTTNSGFN